MDIPVTRRPPSIPFSRGADHARRIERVVAFIGDHLDATLDLDRLAQVACFSPYHFHRVYRAVMGETVADTVRRRRLHRAATDLADGALPIARVARRAGYGSVAAFTRAFRAAYGLPPVAYRSRGRIALPFRARTEEEDMYDVTIRRFPPLRLLALAHRGDYQTIGDTFDRLFAWAGARGLNPPGTRSIGIYYSDPDIVPVAERRSDACLLVAGAPALDGELRWVDLPGGRVAVARHRGPYAELERAYRWLYREWLATSGEEPADRPCFEEYINDPRALPPQEWLTDVCLPIAGRG